METPKQSRGKRRRTDSMLSSGSIGPIDFGYGTSPGFKHWSGHTSRSPSINSYNMWLRCILPVLFYEIFNYIEKSGQNHLLDYIVLPILLAKKILRKIYHTKILSLKMLEMKTRYAFKRLTTNKSFIFKISDMKARL